MKSLIMLGGGIDSTVLLYMLKASGIELHGLFVDFGKDLNKGKNSVLWFCDKLKIPLEIVNFEMSQLHKPEEDSRNWKFYPGFGMILMTIAAGVADKNGCTSIYSGEYDALEEKIKPEDTHETNWSYSSKRIIYDCNTLAFQEMLALYRKLYSLNRMQISFPFIGFSQADVIKLGVKLEVALSETMSCGNSDCSIHCGFCVKCQERKQAFKGAKERDFTEYEFV